MNINLLILTCLTSFPLMSMTLVSYDEAVTQAISDAPYNNKELWENHPDAYAAIIQQAVIHAYIERRDAYSTRRMFDYINKETSTLAKQLIVPTSAHYNSGKAQVKTACGHIFHRNCIKPWLTHHQNCPNCITEITDKRLKYHSPSKSSNIRCTICQEELGKNRDEKHNEHTITAHKNKNHRYRPY